MAAAALKVMCEFPDIRNDFTRVDNGVKDASKDLTTKLKQVRYVISEPVCVHILWCMAHICWCRAHILTVCECMHIADSTPLQITRGMKAARQADTCTLKGAILGLAKDHAARLGQTLNIGLKKDQRGISNEATACLFLPPEYVVDYLSDPEE